MKYSALISSALLLAQSITQAAAQAPAAPAVVASVNGFAITEQSVDDEILRIVRDRSQGRVFTPKRMKEVRDSMYQGVLERMIDDRLLDEEAARQGFTLSAEDMQREVEKGFDIYVLSTGLPKPFAAEQIQASQGLSLDEFIALRASEPDFRRAILHRRLLQRLYPEETRVTPEEVEARYAAKASSDFTLPTVVRASHILIGADERDQQGRQAALDKARSLREQAVAPSADFAAIALAHSTCPSKAQGGDLGYFPREKMVKPFSDAAFALSVGAVSEVVESQFGYHVILVTERREGRTLSLSEANDAIQDTLEVEKVDQLRAAAAARFRESASIVYGDASKG